MEANPSLIQFGRNLEATRTRRRSVDPAVLTDISLNRKSVGDATAHRCKALPDRYDSSVTDRVHAAELARLASLTTRPKAVGEVLRGALGALRQVVPYDLAVIYDLDGSDSGLYRAQQPRCCVWRTAQGLAGCGQQEGPHGCVFRGAVAGDVHVMPRGDRPVQVNPPRSSREIGRARPPRPCYP